MRGLIKQGCVAVLSVVCVSGLLSACSPPTRPTAKAVPTETLKVNPELVKNKTEGQLK